ncbi:MAG: PhnA domain-containing protein [Rhizobiaceae bacterium]
MALEDDLKTRANGVCEMCNATENLTPLAVAPRDDSEAENCIYACSTCTDQIQETTSIDKHHWTCLNESAWSQELGVQVIAWRMLGKLNEESWAQDLLGQIYLDDETTTWAQTGFASNDEDNGLIHRDCNGAVLTAGDSVTLIKDLNVKGGGFTAKRGTMVRNISLVADNDGHIEGRVSGQQIVILTEFVKKA